MPYSGHQLDPPPPQMPLEMVSEVYSEVQEPLARISDLSVRSPIAKIAPVLRSEQSRPLDTPSLR